MSLGLVPHSGAHPGNYIHGFVRDELERLGVSSFADLKRRTLVVTAARNLNPASLSSVGRSRSSQSSGKKKVAPLPDQRS